MFFIKEDKTNWKYLLIVAIIATVVGAGVLWCIKMSEIKIPENIVKDETADWKTYRNDEYGFEIRYPFDWIVVKEGAGFIVFADAKEAEIQKEKQAGEIRCIAGVYVYNNENALSLYDWAIKEFGKPEDKEAGKISVAKFNNLEGIKYEFMSMGIETNVLLQKNGKIIDIQTTFDGCENLNTVFNQMLSTFKFIEPQDERCSVFLSQPKPEAGDEIALPIDCKIDIGKDFTNWRFSISDKQESNVAIEIWNENDQFIQKIAIYDPTITIDYFWDGYINFTYDINFDGYKDLRIVDIRAASFVSYDYWIFNPRLKKFEKDPVLTKIINPSFDSNKKLIESVYLSLRGTGVTTYRFVNGKYIKGTYNWTENK